MRPVAASFESILFAEGVGRRGETFIRAFSRQRTSSRSGAEKAVEQFLIAILFLPRGDVSRRTAAGGESRGAMPPPARVGPPRSPSPSTDTEPDEVAAAGRPPAGKLKSRNDVRRAGGPLAPRPRDGQARACCGSFREYFRLPGGHRRLQRRKHTLQAAGLHKNGWEPNFFVSDADRLVEWFLGG